MSDFLSSLAQRSSSSTNDVLPTSKARYQPDANETGSFEVDREVDSGNRRSSLDTNSYRDTLIAGDHLARRSRSSVEAVVEPSESKPAFEREILQPTEVRRESKKQLSALQILCANYSGENLIDVALCLIHRTTKYKNIKKCVDILLQRKLQSQSQTLENILGHIRSGRNPVITSSSFTFSNH